MQNRSCSASCFVSKDPLERAILTDIGLDKRKQIPWLMFQCKKTGLDQPFQSYENNGGSTSTLTGVFIFAPSALEMRRNATACHLTQLILRRNITSVMTCQPQVEVIKNYPIENGLDSFRTFFNSTCKDRRISCTPDAVSKLGDEGRTGQRLIWSVLSNYLADIQSLALSLLSALQHLPATRLLRSQTSQNTLQSDLLRLISAVASRHFDFDHIRPLFNAILIDKLDYEIWGQVYKSVTESTPLPWSIDSSLEQTLWLRNTSSFANSLEHCKYVDNVLKEELGLMYVGSTTSTKHTLETWLTSRQYLKHFSSSVQKAMICSLMTVGQDG